MHVQIHITLIILQLYCRGITLVRSNKEFDVVVENTAPTICTIIHPQVEIAADSRILVQRKLKFLN